MQAVEIPPLYWYQADPFSEIGNEYTGSVGDTSIHWNAFHYKVSFFRPKEDAAYFVAQAYDSKSYLSADGYHTEHRFSGTEEGFQEMQQWLNQELEDHQSSGRSDEKLTF